MAPKKTRACGRLLSSLWRQIPWRPFRDWVNWRVMTCSQRMPRQKAPLWGTPWKTSKTIDYPRFGGGGFCRQSLRRTLVSTHFMSFRLPFDNMQNLELNHTVFSAPYSSNERARPSKRWLFRYLDDLDCEVRCTAHDLRCTPGQGMEE